MNVHPYDTVCHDTTRHDKTPFTLNPKSYNFNFVSKNPCDLLLPFTDAFVIEHIFIQLSMDPSVVWHPRRMNKSWYLVVNNSLAWNTPEIVRFNNASYHQSITKLGIPKYSLNNCMMFELECLKYCVMGSTDLLG
jgi:hypothetical protein